VALLETKSESHSAEKATNAEIEKKELRKQRKALEEERRKFTDAAARLQEERTELEKERLQAIEADRQRKSNNAVAVARLDNASEDTEVQASATMDKKEPQQTSKANERGIAGQKAVKRDHRASVTSTALQSILAQAADTPPARPLLAVRTNSLQTKDSQVKHKADIVAMEKTTVRRPPSSAALAARDRVQRAVQAAKAKSGSVA
jgi:hypothetical protein